MPFTPEELKEMAEFDASLEDDFQLTEKEKAFSTTMDNVAITETRCKAERLQHLWEQKAKSRYESAYHGKKRRKKQ